MKLNKFVSQMAVFVALVFGLAQSASSAQARNLVAERGICPSLQGEARRVVLGGDLDPRLSGLRETDAMRAQECLETPPGGPGRACMASNRGRMKPVTDQGYRGTCHVHAVASLLEYGTSDRPDFRISTQCMARFSAAKDAGCPWRLLLNLIHQPRKYLCEVLAQDPPVLLGGLFSDVDCPYDWWDRDHIPNTALHIYPHYIPPAHLRVHLPRHDRGEDPLDFLRDHLRSGHILLASLFVVNSPWWDTRSSSKLSHNQVVNVAQGTDSRSERLRIIYQASRRLPPQQTSSKFRKFIEAVNDPLTPPSLTTLAQDCNNYLAEAERSGKDEAQFFAEQVEENGILPGKRHFSTHAIVITGYNDIDKTIEFRNSWGSSWKDEGYGHMTYDYFRRFLQSYWYRELPIMAYKPDLDGSYHTSGHPDDTHPLY